MHSRATLFTAVAGTSIPVAPNNFAPVASTIQRCQQHQAPTSRSAVHVLS
jgi:hypothetical protein